MDFVDIYIKYRKPLIKFALGVVGRPEDAQDIVSDVFTEVLGNWDKIQKQDQWLVDSYMFTATRYKIYKYFMRWSKKHMRLIDTEEDFSIQPDVFSLLSCEEIERIMYITLEGCTKMQNKAFILYRIEGMDSDEVCKKLKISKNQLFYLDQRIRKTLSKRLAQYGKVAPLLDEERKAKLIELADKLGNMAMACRIMGHSKATGLKLNKIRKKL